MSTLPKTCLIKRVGRKLVVGVCSGSESSEGQKSGLEAKVRVTGTTTKQKQTKPCKPVAISQNAVAISQNAATISCE